MIERIDRPDFQHLEIPSTIRKCTRSPGRTGERADCCPAKPLKQMGDDFGQFVGALFAFELSVPSSSAFACRFRTAGSAHAEPYGRRDKVGGNRAVTGVLSEPKEQYCCARQCTPLDAPLPHFSFPERSPSLRLPRSRHSRCRRRFSAATSACGDAMRCGYVASPTPAVCRGECKFRSCTSCQINQCFGVSSSRGAIVR